MNSTKCLHLMLMLFLCLGPWARAADPKPGLEYEQLDLADGRKLKKVVVKSYDSAKNRVLVMAGSTALFVALDLLPEATYYVTCAWLLSRLKPT